MNNEQQRLVREMQEAWTKYSQLNEDEREYVWVAPSIPLGLHPFWQNHYPATGGKQ